MKTLGASFIVFTLLTGCALFTRQNVKTALDAADMFCALNLQQVTSSTEVAAACGIAEALIPELDKLLEAKRKASAARAARGGCP